MLSCAISGPPSSTLTLKAIPSNDHLWAALAVTSKSRQGSISFLRYGINRSKIFFCFVDPGLQHFHIFRIRLQKYQAHA